MHVIANLICRNGIILLLATIPLAAAAQAPSYARTGTHVILRAGPANDYPVIASYPPNVGISVQGCTAGYGWCDVIGPDNARGWIYAANIQYAYQTTYVPLPTYAVQIGVPIVAFSVGAYWGAYYRNQPFYSSYPVYVHHRPPPYHPPHGRPPPYRPPPGYNPPPGYRPPSEGGGRPPGGSPPSGRPPGSSGNPPANGRPPSGGLKPPAGGRPPSGLQPP